MKHTLILEVPQVLHSPCGAIWVTPSHHPHSFSWPSTQFSDEAGGKSATHCSGICSLSQQTCTLFGTKMSHWVRNTVVHWAHHAPSVLVMAVVIRKEFMETYIIYPSLTIFYYQLKIYQHTIYKVIKHILSMLISYVYWQTDKCTVLADIYTLNFTLKYQYPVTSYIFASWWSINGLLNIGQYVMDELVEQYGLYIRIYIQRPFALIEVA